MSTFRMTFWLTLIPMIPLCAQAGTAAPQTPPARTARRAPPTAESPAPRDTLREKFTAIRQRYQKEINDERAALQRSMDHMREDLVAAGWHPMMMHRGMMMQRGMMMRGRGAGGFGAMRRGTGSFGAMRRGPMQRPGFGRYGQMGRGGGPGRGMMTQRRPGGAQPGRGGE